MRIGIQVKIQTSLQIAFQTLRITKRNSITKQSLTQSLIVTITAYEFETQAISVIVHKMAYVLEQLAPAERFWLLYIVLRVPHTNDKWLLLSMVLQQICLVVQVLAKYRKLLTSRLSQLFSKVFFVVSFYTRITSQKFCDDWEFCLSRSALVVLKLCLPTFLSDKLAPGVLVKSIILLSFEQL